MPRLQHLQSIPGAGPISIVRLDELDSYVTGNKAFKLKSNLLQFQLEGQARLLTFGGAYSNHLVAVAARFMKGSPRVKLESAELLMDPVALLDTQGMPVVSPRMADFQRLLQDSTQRANRLQGLLSRSNLPLSGASGLLGGMMAPR